jgi:thiol-disulfide isomerase/thioredoxin
MNKKLLSTFLLVLVALAGQAKTFKTIKTPVAMTCVNVHLGELKAREVIMRDTATTVRFTMQYQPGQYFQFVRESFLMDEAGNRYPLRSAEGLQLSTWVQSPESGVVEFTMNFEPLPKNTQVFDFIEGDVNGAFMLLGIRDKKTTLKAPTLQELSAANPWTVPADWFNTDTITIKGRIEGYDAEQFGYTAMECYFEDVFDKSTTTLVLEIAPDGTFCKKFKASYPVKQRFITNVSKNGFRAIPFYARPGETIDITVRRGANGQYQCVYNNGSSRDVRHWLSNYDMFDNINDPLHLFKGNFTEANQKAEEVWQNLLYRLQAESHHSHYTPMELQLSLADAQASFAYAMMDYAMYREVDLTKREMRDGRYYMEIIDSAEWKGLRDEKNYTALHRVDFNNPLMFASSDFSMLVNRIQFAKPVRRRQIEDIADENGIYEYTVKNALKGLDNSYAGLSDLMGVTTDNLMAQICMYKDMVGSFDSWRSNEDQIPEILADTTMTEAERKQTAEEFVTLSKMYPPYLATFTNHYIHQKAEHYYAYKMAQKDFATPLPNAPMAEVIHKLTAKYPGKFLLIDFWGMGCGPCRAAIQSSKQKRAEIAKRNDIKLVFIAGERTTEGSDAYKKYVAEWLADEETVCLTNEDYARLQELFGFNGIPHYETITPDGYRVRDDLRIDGFHNFDYDIQRLKEKLK